MKIRKKNALIAATAAFAVAFAAGGAALKLNVIADEAESEILTIRQGASVRISENYAQNGIRYELNMQKSDYEDLKESNPNVVFGMFIAPVDYETLYAPLTEKILRAKMRSTAGRKSLKTVLTENIRARKRRSSTLLPMKWAKKTALWCGTLRLSISCAAKTAAPIIETANLSA